MAQIALAMKFSAFYRENNVSKYKKKKNYIK